MKRLLLIPLILTACASSPDYQGAMQRLMDERATQCQATPQPIACAPSGAVVTRMYNTKAYSVDPREADEAVVTHFDYRLQTGQAGENAVAYIGKRSGQWTVLSASTGPYRIFPYPQVP